MDFLSYLSKDKTSQPVGAVLVLNFTNLLQRTLPYINDSRFVEVRLCLYNDDAGEAATRDLRIGTHGCLVVKPSHLFSFLPSKISKTKKQQPNRRGPEGSLLLFNMFK